MDTNPQPPQVIFFFGAGASVAAGVPDTYSFVNKFIESEDGNKKDTIKKIVKTLEKWKGYQIEVELLLETLTKLESKEEEPLLQFYENGRYHLDGYYEKTPLIKDLKDFIKSKAIVHEDKIGYLEPLRSFVEEHPPLSVISVNYDTSIEQFCNVHKLVYQDGFDVHWNPKNFESEHTDIRLYKLHGSVMWYQSDRGNYLKLPVMEGASQLQLITGEKAENLMLYPMQKWDYAEPLLELLILVKNLLESKGPKFLVVVGYSFRDDHIQSILWDAARKNKEIRLILIDPKADEIYSNKLKYYKTGQVSSLAGKVTCLPYLFENVLPSLKNNYLRHLTLGHTSERVQHNTEIQGGTAYWISPLQEYLNAEYTEKVEDLLEKIDVTELEKNNWQFCLELYLKMAVNLVINKQTLEGNEYFDKFNKLLYQMVVERILADIVPMIGYRKTMVVLNFNYLHNALSGGSFSAESLKNVILGLFDFCNTRLDFVKDVDTEFNAISDRIRSLKEYLEPFKGDGIEFEAYLKLREEKISNIKKFSEYYEIAQNTYQGSQTLADTLSSVKASQLRTELISVVLEIEKNILKERFQKTS